MKAPWGPPYSQAYQDLYEDNTLKESADSFSKVEEMQQQHNFIINKSWLKVSDRSVSKAAKAPSIYIK